MAMRNSHPLSTPLGGNHPETCIEVRSIDLCERYIATNGNNSKNHDDSGRRTSIRNLRFKSIVLLSDDPHIIGPAVSKSKEISLMPYMSNMDTESPNRFMEDILTKCVHVCLSRKSVENKAFVSFISRMLERRKEEFGTENQKAAAALRMKAILYDGLETLPSELSNLYSIVLNGNLTPDEIVRFLEGTYSENFIRVQTLLKELNVGPRQKLIIKPRMYGPGNYRYLSKCYESVLEAFDDARSYTRRHLLQLFHLPNVQTLRSESNPETLEASIEIMPNNVDDYVAFLEFVHTGQFNATVQDNLIVNGQPFIGTIESHIDCQDVMQVLKYLLADKMKSQSRDLKKLAEEKKYDEIVNVVKRISINEETSGHRVNSLTSLCATKIYKTFLDRGDLSPFDYLAYLRNEACPDMLTEIRSSDGYNALHLAVKCERQDYLMMLFYANKWAVLRNDVVKRVNVNRESLHVGYAPRRLAEALSFKNSGFTILTKFDEYDRYVRYMPPLHKACLAGIMKYVSVLVESRPYLMQEKDEYHANCLFYACASGNAALVDFLILKGVPRNTRNRMGDTPLHIAAMFGHLGVLNVLYKHCFEIRGTLNRNGYNALYYSAAFGHVDALRLYKEKGFKIDARALTVAAKHQQKEAFKFIINELTDVNEGRDQEGRLAIHYSAVNGDVSIVQHLIVNNADITATDQFGRNALHLAAEHGRKRVLEILIAKAKTSGCLEKIISAKGVFTGNDLAVVVRGRDRYRKAWHWLQLRRLSIRAFKDALKSGQLDVNNYGQIVKSGFGSSPDKQSRALMEKRTEDVAMEAKPDMTPLHIAALRDHANIVKLLLENGALPNVVDYEGSTAVHYAAMNDNTDILKLLCTAGASVTVKTADGRTPLDIAEENGSQSARNFLRASEQIEKSKNFHEVLSRVITDLSLESLQRKRSAGHDLRQYFIDELRGLTIDINCLLQDL